MLDFPDVIDAELVGQLDLRQRVLEQAMLGAFRPGARQLMLVQKPEAHGSLLVSGPAAIDDQASARHEAGIVGRQEHDALGDVVGDAEAADRVQGERDLGVPFRCRWCPAARARMAKVCWPMSVSMTPGWIELTRTL